MTEIRVVNETTGGEKGAKPQRMDLLPWAQLMEVAQLYAKGAEKYAAHNWRRGYDWSLSFAAMQRHAALFWEGVDYDEETGCHHLTSVVFHALALLFFRDAHSELDDRPSTAARRREHEADDAADIRKEIGEYQFQPPDSRPPTFRPLPPLWPKQGNPLPNSIDDDDNVEQA